MITLHIKAALHTLGVGESWRINVDQVIALIMIRGQISKAISLDKAVLKLLASTSATGTGTGSARRSS